jgi:hypothetical protein
MSRRPLAVLLAAILFLAGGTGCTGNVNLTEALEITDVLTGWYDNGVTADGKNHLLPSITFRVKNKSARSISSVEIDTAFWQEGADGENESVLVRAIGGQPLAAGASTEPLTVRAPHGYTLEGARAEFFANRLFKDFVIKLFGKRGGRIFRLGEYKVERRIIPQVQRAPDRP